MSCKVENLLISKISVEMGVNESVVRAKINNPIMSIGLSSVVMLELIQETIDELGYVKEVTSLFGSSTKQSDITITTICITIKK